MTPMRRQAGLTLVELMIASVVALVMLAGVGQLFLSTRQMNIADEASADIQDTGRHILHYISEQARQAGMLGCAKLSATNYTSSITAYDQEYYHPFNVGLQGYEKGVSDLPPVLNSLPIAGGTDILVVRRASDLGFRLIQPQDDDTLYGEHLSTVNNACKGKTLPKINDICQDDILVAVDCQKARSFVVSSISTTDIGGATVVEIKHGAGNTPSSWGGPASDNPMDKFDIRDTTISKAATTAYYVDNSGVLFERVNNGNANRLASGIDYLRILYGLDSDNDGSVNRYVDASALSADPQVPDNFNQVVSLQIAILVRSQQPVLDANEVASGTTNSYDLLGTTVTLNADRYLHKVFQTTIKLRNGGEG
jgi:type IV pilus assembly protein PilW